MAALLLILLLISMACATVAESQRGTEYAAALFYHAAWFEVLLGLLGLNMFAALILRYPFGKKDAGFILAHMGILSVLAGSLITQEFGVDGQIVLTEGQSTSVMGVNQDTVSVRNRETGKTVNFENGRNALSDFNRINDLSIPVITGESWQAEILEYVPDSAWRDVVEDSNPQVSPAIEIALTHESEKRTSWVFANQPGHVGPLDVSFRAVDTLEAMSFSPDSETRGESKGNLHIEYKGVEYVVALEQCTDAAHVLGDSGCTVRLTNYLPHAVVGPDRTLVNSSDRPVNPAVEVEFVTPEGKEKRLAFARFPDFGAMHEKRKNGNLHVRFIASEQHAGSIPLEITGGPDGSFLARFNHEDGEAEITELALGEAIPTPWGPVKLTILSSFQNARFERKLEEIDPVRKKRHPAIRLSITSLKPGETAEEFWLPKDTARVITIGDTPLEISFTSYKEEPLDFKMTLEEFVIGRYPGTEQPSSFESHVSVTNDIAGTSVKSAISMNKPLLIEGWRIYQSSFDSDGGLNTSILGVSKDPGQVIVFSGYIITFVGVLILLLNRASHRNIPRENRQRKTNNQVTAFAAFLLMSPALIGLAQASEPFVPSTESLEPVRNIVVQHDGRYMPIDTLARDLVSKVAGKRNFNGFDPLSLFFAWMANPQDWREIPLIEISDNSELRALLDLPEQDERFSYNKLVADARLLQLFDQLQTRSNPLPLDPLQQKVSEIGEKLLILQQIFNGEVARIIPDPEDANGMWEPVRPMPPTRLANSWGEFKEAVSSNSEEAILTKGTAFAALCRELPAAYRPSDKALSIELHYNRLQPFTTAWKIMVVAAVLAALGLYLRHWSFDGLVILIAILGFGVLTYGLLLRWQIAGRIPAANMFESLLFLSWGMGALAIVAMIIQRNRIVPLTASAMGALALILADCLLDPFIRPIPPVLLNTFWMSIHVPVIMVSYSVLALAMLIAHAQVIFLAFAPNQRKLSAAIDRMHYWYIAIGSLLLFLGIATGSMWAASSWGRYWGWDPKEVWSLIALLGYLAILHLRIAPEAIPRWVLLAAMVMGIAVIIHIATIMAPISAIKVLILVLTALVAAFFLLARGEYATAVKSIMAFWMIIMTYLGVNYVLASGLHSYGFGTGAVAGKMLFCGMLDLCLIILCGTVYYLRTLSPRLIADMGKSNSLESGE